MATKLTPDSITLSSAGTTAFAFASAPMGGFSVQASLQGGATAATWRVLVRNSTDQPYVAGEEVELDSSTLPSDVRNVYPPYEGAQVELVSITGGGSVLFTALGLGL